MTCPPPLHLVVYGAVFFLYSRKMRKYEKPYLSPKEQVELLMSRGMEITDLAKAEECLARIGYYRLSAYWESLIDKLTETLNSCMEIL